MKPQPPLPTAERTMDESIANINQAIANDVPVIIALAELEHAGFTRVPRSDHCFTTRYGGLYQWDPETDRLTFLSLSCDQLPAPRYTYNYASPDCIPIYPEDFPTIEDAQAELDRFVERLRFQGFYSSPQYGRIDLDLVKNCCELIVNKIEDEEEPTEWLCHECENTIEQDDKPTSCPHCGWTGSDFTL